jgi:hypothetical protein
MPETANPPAPKIVLGVPAYGGTLTTTWVFSLLPVLIEGGFIDRIERVDNDSHVGRARNTLAARFLAGNGDWLLFIDTDIGFSVADLKRVFAQALRHPTDITGGMYPLKRLLPGAVVNALPGERPDKTGLVEVREIGTGFMFIPRCVLENMVAKCPEIAFGCDSGENATEGELRHDFFQSGVYTYPDGKKRWLSEDYYFCQRHRDLGGKIWIDCSLRLTHRGTFDYPAAPEVVKEAHDFYEKAGAYKAKAAAA